jgi:acetyl esterase
MSLDARVAQLWSGLVESGFRGFADGQPEEARAAYCAIAAARQDEAARLSVAEITKISIGEIPARVYRPDGAAEGVVVYFHGGGYVVGDLDTHDLCARLLCTEVGATVISVDYRRAPEHRYPAAAEDAIRALEWVVENAGLWGATDARVAVAGDSAGGNLAAVSARRAADEGWPLAAQALIYPNVDFGARSGSMREHANAPFLTLRDIDWFFAQYTGVEIDDPAATSFLQDPELNPLVVPPGPGVCSAVIATAGYDPLRDQGAAYAHALALAGTPTVYRDFPDLAHGFYPWRSVPRAREAASWIHGELRRLLIADPATSGMDSVS